MTDRAVIDDAEILAGLRETLAAVERVCSKVRESLDAQRYVEAAGWVERLSELSAEAHDGAGWLAAGEASPITNPTIEREQKKG